jgi:hypothetical protein
MALEKQDITAIQQALQPSFDSLGKGLKVYIDTKIKEVKIDVVNDLSEVIQEGFTMVGERFNDVDRDLKLMHRQIRGLQLDVVELKDSTDKKSW